MIKSDNFIYFLTVCGFFVGLIFSVLSHDDPIHIVWSTITITILFYIISLASAGYFINKSDITSNYTLKSDFYDYQLGKAMGQIEKRENFLRDSQRYIRDLEEELYRDGGLALEGVDEEKKAGENNV